MLKPFEYIFNAKVVCNEINENQIDVKVIKF